jgi:3'-phosphoadenosine 5'-phosphosulfate sulfotransferase (PAPS reductase)/FAD synthetase
MAERRADISPRDPVALVEEAKERWRPIKTYCLFSGGNDSAVLAHRCREHYDALFYIDTGTAVPSTTEPEIVGVEDHVRSYARWLGKPLEIRRSGDAYRTMVLGDELWWRRYRIRAARERRPFSIEQMIAEDRRAGRVSSRDYGQAPYGFPGKGQHGKAYSRLKERRIEELLRQTKQGHPRRSAVLFLSGIRRAESRRRAKREPFTERGSAKFCNPLIDWTATEVAEHRRRFELPVSDVAALLHRSGECNCGAFARAEEERKTMRAFWPQWWAETIESLETEAEARGIRWCRWGGYDLNGNQAAGSGAGAGLLCANCAAASDSAAPSRGGALPRRPLRRGCAPRSTGRGDG